MVQFLTNLADQAVILPLVLAVLFLLLAVGELRAAGWWAGAIALALGGTLLAKLVFIPCGHLLPGLAVRSPSGHTASAAAAYAGMMMLGAQATRSEVNRWVALGLGAAIVCIIAGTRIVLHAHTLQETVIGALIGAVASLLLAIPRPLFRGGILLHRGWLLALPLLIVPFAFGYRFNAEGWISEVSWHVARLLRVCQ